MQPRKPDFLDMRVQFAGVNLVELARQFGTPTFLYDAAMIRERFAELTRFDWTVRYAQKACSTLSILQLVRSCGAVVDSVSANEIRRAMRVGYTTRPSESHNTAGRCVASPIEYTADIFDQDALTFCVEHGVHVNCGSISMIEQLGEQRETYAKSAPCELTLRINPGFGHGHSRKTNTGGELSKHGIWHEQLAEAIAVARHGGWTVTGLHMHIGSGTDEEHLSQVAGAMEQMALRAMHISEQQGGGADIRSISAGGGLPIPYQKSACYVDTDRYFALWDATRKRLETQLNRAIRLEVEPGRFPVAESGALLAEIRAVKKQGDRLFYLLDAGFNHLVRPAMYGSYHPISVVPRDGVTERPRYDVIVGGPLCESGDVFTQECRNFTVDGESHEESGYVVSRRLPQAAVGDYLLIERAGAYGFAMSSNYNSKPLAAEVLIDDGGQIGDGQCTGDGQKHHVREIRRRQTFDDLIANEIF